MSTGALLGFAPAANGVAAVPRLAAGSTTTRAVISSFHPKPSGPVYALGRVDSTLFFGGAFSGTGSSNQKDAAAVSPAGVVQAWASKMPDGRVSAIIANVTLGRVVLGGNVSGLKEQMTTNRSSHMFDAITGTTKLPWGVGTKVKNWGMDAGIISLMRDGTHG